jgi:iron complex outermembrane receptor protein
MEDLQGNPGTIGGVGVAGGPGHSPRSQAGLRLQGDLTPAVTFDAFLRYVDALPAQTIPAYTELNARLGWRPRPGLELSLNGENLLSPEHMEFGSDSLPVIPTRVPRSVFGKAILQF